MAITSSTSKVVRSDIPEGEEDGEESDEYEVVDEEGEEDDEDEDDEEDEEERGGGLTALLLNSHGDVEDDEDKGWVPGGGREPADYSGDEDDDEHVLEGSNVQSSDKPPSKNAVPSQSMGRPGETANGSGKKRARELEEESTEEQNGKKTKKV